MKFTIIEAEQRSEAWFAARAGRLTGSKADCILSKGKGSAESVGRRDYRLQLACEILTGQPQEESFTNAAMQWGIEQESYALRAYEAATGDVVRRTGFLQHNEHRAGCSLDGDLNNFQGILELKCPKTATHVGYWRSGGVPSTYLPQLTHNMWVTGAEYVDFASFDPRLPKALQLYRVRLLRAEMAIEAYEAAAIAFLREVDAEVKALRELAGIDGMEAAA
jgi:putative phage-type endonuclease